MRAKDQETITNAKCVKVAPEGKKKEDEQRYIWAFSFVPSACSWISVRH
jgi:hypothetical protein